MDRPADMTFLEMGVGQARGLAIPRASDEPMADLEIMEAPNRDRPKLLSS